MIAYVKGELAYINENSIIVETNGIGYEINVPLTVIANLPQVGNEVKIYTYTHVKEDAFKLFGFLTRDDLAMYKLLITVNGVGPKGALGIFSIMDADALRFAILSDDTKAISKAPGIGGKTASKVVLELKDKCNIEDMISIKASNGDQTLINEKITASNDAIQALVALGYTQTEGAKAIKKIAITEEMSVEDILKQALKNI